MSHSRTRRWAAAAGTAFALAAASWLLAGFAFYIGNGLDAGVLLQALEFFAPPSLLLALLLAVLGLGGVFERRWRAGLAAGGSVIAALLVSTGARLTGAPLSGAEQVSALLSSLLGVGLVFALAAIVLATAWAPRLFGKLRSWRVPPKRRERPLAFVRHPAASLADGLLTHLERSSVDVPLALEQWDNYCATLIAEGFDLVELPAADELPDSVFMEDVVLFFDNLAVITRPGAEPRRAETEAVAERLRQERGLRLERLEQPATLDGGDVLVIGKTVYVGASERTNGAGIQQLRALLAPLGYRIVAVPVHGALHLKTAVTALPDGSVIGHSSWVQASQFPEFLAVPEAAGASVLAIQGDTVVLSAAAPRTAELLASLGYRVIAIDVSEFEKLEGGVTCLSARWEKSSINDASLG